MVEHRHGKGFVGDKRTAGITHQAELQRKAEPVMLATTNLDFQPIGRRQGIMTDQTVFISWNAEKLLSIMRLEKSPPGHRCYSLLYALVAKPLSGNGRLRTGPEHTVHKLS